MDNIRILRIFILLILMSFGKDIKSQSNLSHLNKPYKIKITGTMNTRNTKYILYSVTDSAVIIISKADYGRIKKNPNFQKITVSYNKIEEIIISKKNRFAHCIGNGPLVGAVIAAALGYANGDDPPKPRTIELTKEGKAAFAGIGGAIVGLATGAIIGAIQIHIPINKKYKEFSINKDYLSKRALVN